MSTPKLILSLALALISCNILQATHAADVEDGSSPECAALSKLYNDYLVRLYYAKKIADLTPFFAAGENARLQQIGPTKQKGELKRLKTDYLASMTSSQLGPMFHSWVVKSDFARCHATGRGFITSKMRATPFKPVGSLDDGVTRVVIFQRESQGWRIKTIKPGPDTLEFSTLYLRKLAKARDLSSIQSFFSDSFNRTINQMSPPEKQKLFRQLRAKWTDPETTEMGYTSHGLELERRVYFTGGATKSCNFTFEELDDGTLKIAKIW